MLTAVNTDENDDTFLTEQQLRKLTGFAQPGRQIEQLRKQGIAFYLNGAGRPVVARAAVEGKTKHAAAAKKPWVPRVLSEAA